MVGQNIGKYRVQERVGRGGMGTVYKAIDETLHREVAIKVLNAELNDPEVAKRFRAEAITVARLSHPGIATIYELFQHEGQWLMVMEFVRGETLEHMVERMGPLSPQRAAELCMQALAALAHAHSMGVVHRDLKPANLMITETGAVKIMDFGIARVAGTEHLTSAGFMMGTPAYMSPEQVRGEEIDARADLYALGVVFYRLITAKLPFKGDTPFAMAQSQVNDPPTPVGLVRPDLPPWVEPVVVRALAKSPEERFQSAAEFHEAFARCLAGLPLTTMYGGGTARTAFATPPRPMPSPYHTPMPTPAWATSPPLPAPTSGAHPLPQGPSSGEFAETMLRPSGAVPAAGAATGAVTGAVPGTSTGSAPTVPLSSTGQIEAASAVTAAQGALPGSSASTTAARPVPASVSGKAKSNTPMLAAAGAAVVILAIAGYFLFRWPSTPADQTQAPPPVETVPPPETTPPPADAAGAGAPGTGAETTQPPAQAAAPGVTPGSTTPPAGSGAAGSVSPPPSTAATKPAAQAGAPPPDAPPATSARGQTGAPAATGGRAGAASPNPPVDDSLVGFGNVKIQVVTGRNSKDEDVLLNFGGGQIAVLPRSGGAALTSLGYREISRATYVKARNPKWDSSLPSPPENLDVGSFLRTSRHWLVLQTAQSFVILRLEDDNFARVLETIEARTGLKVVRPTGDEKGV